MTEQRAATEPPALPFPSAFLHHLGFVVNKVAERLNQQAEAVTLPHGLNVRQYGLLLLLHTQGPQAQIELSQQVGLDRTSVMRTVDLLEGRSLVRRGPDPVDRRKHSVALTAAGAELVNATLPAVRSAEGEVTGALSAQEQAQLLGLLVRLLTHDDTY